MIRCISLGSIGPRVLDDLALILNELLVPSLQCGHDEEEETTEMVATDLGPSSNNTTTAAQVFNAGKRLQSGASDSCTVEDESVYQLFSKANCPCNFLF